MKKIVTVIFLGIITCFMVGCTPGAASNSNTTSNSTASTSAANTTSANTTNITVVNTTNSEGMFVIDENTFITQCNDVYLHPDEYKDNPIKLEGIYTEVAHDSDVHHYVIRNAASADGKAISVGFEFKYDKDIPKVGDWIEVIGKAETIDGHDGSKGIILDVSSLTILEKRGLETVTK